MNSRKVFQRIRWNFLIAISFALTIAIFAVGVAYAATTVGFNDDPPDAFPQSPLTLGDWGDLPSSYGFIVAYPNGAMHQPGNDLQLGPYKDHEHLPLPSVGAVGDDNDPGDDGDGTNDEDGVARDMTQSWTNEAFVDVIVEVNGCADNVDCYLNGWIDWNGNSIFEPGDQIFYEQTVRNGFNTLTFQIPAAGDYQEGFDVYAHFRLCSSQGAPPTGCNTVAGYANDGEVEDYYWEFGTTAVELVSLEATTNYAVPFALLAGALILLFGGGAILAFRRNRA